MSDTPRKHGAPRPRRDSDAANEHLDPAIPELVALIDALPAWGVRSRTSGMRIIRRLDVPYVRVSGALVMRRTIVEDIADRLDEERSGKKRWTQPR